MEGVMNYIPTIPKAEADQELSAVYGFIEKSFGMLPAVFQSMSLRQDLLDPLALYVKRLMLEKHELSRFTKEILAAYVSRQNDCAY
mgnify:FL=1